VEFETGKKYILSLWLEICMLPINSYFANKMVWQINLNKLCNINKQLRVQLIFNAIKTNFSNHKQLQIYKFGKVAQEELGWGAAWGMSGVKFATGCYWVTPRGVVPCYSPRMISKLP